MPLKASDQKREGIHYEQYQPDNRISNYVDRILYGYAPKDIDHQITIPPSGGIFISYVIGSPITATFQDRAYDKKPRLFIGGQLKNEAPVLIPEKEFGLIGFQLKPTGFYKLFGIHSGVLTDDIKDLYELDAVGCTSILDKIRPDSKKEEIIAIISDYILNKEKPEVDCDTVERVVVSITEAQGNVKIKEIAEKHDMDSRKLRREFLQKIGLSPKYFAKIIQLNTISELLSKGQEEKLNQIALDCGYYDQAHFIHDFQKYLGMNPMKFVRSDDRFLRTFLSRMRD